VPLGRRVYVEAQKSLSERVCRRARSATRGEFTVTICNAASVLVPASMAESSANRPLMADQLSHGFSLLRSG
jgi:hypothetical protein